MISNRPQLIGIGASRARDTNSKTNEKCITRRDVVVNTEKGT